MALSQIILELLKGLGVSVEIFAITLLFSLPLGLLVAFGRMSKNGVVSGLTKAYISIMRGTPLMLQLFVVYYGPYYLCHIKLSPTYRNSAVYIGFIINYAAYFAEIYRSGIQSMPVGQYEAADILGYTRHHPAAGVEAHPAVRHERGHHPRQGHLARVLHLGHGDVHEGEGPVVQPDLDDSAHRRRRVLLCL